MISGMFSIVYQGMTTRIIPKMKIDFTSSSLQSQIYIDTVNWLLLISVLLVMITFQSSEHLGAAYGLAVTGNMTISALMLLLIFYKKKDNVKVGLMTLLLLIDVTFLLASLTKLPHGGYWSLILAGVPFAIIVIFITGQKKLYATLKPIPYDRFAERYNELYTSVCKIPGAALYFTSDIKFVSPYIGTIFFQNNILYETNIFVSIRMTNHPFGISTYFQQEIEKGLSFFSIETGYLEILDVESLLREHGIDEKTIFYGIENIMSDKMIWNLFGIIKKVSPPFVQFYALPSEKIHGVVTRFIM